MNCSTPSAPEQMTICSQLRNRRARETTKGCQSPNGQATCEAHLRTGCVVAGVRWELARGLDGLEIPRTLQATPRQAISRVGRRLDSVKPRKTSTPYDVTPSQ